MLTGLRTFSLTTFNWASSIESDRFVVEVFCYVNIVLLQWIEARMMKSFTEILLVQTSKTRMKSSGLASRTSRKQFGRQWAWRDVIGQFGREHSTFAAGLTKTVEHSRQKLVWHAVHWKCSHPPRSLGKEREKWTDAIGYGNYYWKMFEQPCLGQTIIVERKYCLAWTSGFSGSSFSSQVKYSAQVRSPWCSVHWNEESKLVEIPRHWPFDRILGIERSGSEDNWCAFVDYYHQCRRNWYTRRLLTKD